MSRVSPIVRNEIMVGTFVALAAIIAFMYLAKKSRERGLPGARHVTFSPDHGTGREPGAPVVMQGITVGEIDDVRLTDDQRMRVEATLHPDSAEPIRAHTRAAAAQAFRRSRS